MSAAFERILQGARAVDGVETVFLLNESGRVIARSAQLQSVVDLVDQSEGQLLFLMDAAAELVAGSETVKLTYRHFNLILRRASSYVLGVIAARSARDEVVHLALKVAARQLQRLPPPNELHLGDAFSLPSHPAPSHSGQFSPAPPTPRSIDDRPTMSSFMAPPLPEPAAYPSSRGSGSPAPPHSSSVRDPAPRSSRGQPPWPEDSARAPRARPTNPESPWAQRPARRRKTGGGGIWGD